MESTLGRILGRRKDTISTWRDGAYGSYLLHSTAAGRVNDLGAESSLSLPTEASPALYLTRVPSRCSAGR